MKKNYIKPASADIALHIEDAILTGSGNIKIDSNETTDNALTNGKIWSSDNWSSVDED